MSPFREATIDLDAISDNVRHLRRLTDVDVIAIVKADAYGHGAIEVANRAVESGVQFLAVATPDEAVDNVKKVIAEWIDTARELGRAIPEPTFHQSFTC